MTMKRTNYYYPVGMLGRLKAASALYGLSVSEIIRSAIEAWLSKKGL